MTRFTIGVGLPPQHATYAQLRDAWLRAEDVGADALWTWDHFYPLYGPEDGPHFECYSLLAAQAALTSRPRLGALVTCNSYRNPDLLADMARTIDHVSGGRFILGIGSGWFERDYTEYGFEFGDAKTRLAALRESLPRIRDRLAKLNPPPVQARLPLMIAGGGEKVMLRQVATYGDMWHFFGTPEVMGAKSKILDEHCVAIGRDPTEIERTCSITDDAEFAQIDEYVAHGFTHFIARVDTPDPEMAMVRKLIAWRDAQG